MLKLCANVSWLFRELPFLERAAAARRAGFSGIEFHSPEGHAAAEVARAARDAGVSIVLFNAWPGDFLTGGPGLSGVPGREGEFRQVLQQACEFGADLGGASVQVGQSRVPDGLSREDCLRTYVVNLRYAASELARVGCRALVEPMNPIDAPGVLIPDARAAAAVLAAVADPHVGLQFDCYHESMSGHDPCRSFKTFAACIAHLQFSDAPGRHEPGTGNIDFPALWKTLVGARFDRWVSAEYRPRGKTTDSLGWLPSVVTTPPAPPGGGE